MSLKSFIIGMLTGMIICGMVSAYVVSAIMDIDSAYAGMEELERPVSAAQRQKWEKARKKHGLTPYDLVYSDGANYDVWFARRKNAHTGKMETIRLW